MQQLAMIYSCNSTHYNYYTFSKERSMICEEITMVDYVTALCWLISISGEIAHLLFFLFNVHARIHCGE